MAVEADRRRCDVDNVSSRRVAEKCGMRRAGRFGEDVREADGRPRDTLLFAMLSREHPRPRVA